MPAHVVRIPAGTRVFFTSDPHYGHRLMIDPQKGRRPWPDVDAMNAGLVENFNRNVTAADYVFFLGDMSAGGAGRTAEYLSQLKGRKFWVPGNHDADLRYKKPVLALFERVMDILELRVPEDGHPEGQQSIVLCHYPLASWNKMHYGSWQLHGHCHGSYPDIPTLKRMDVGVDAVAKRLAAQMGTELQPSYYRPTEYLEVKAELVNRKFEPVDQHGKAIDYES